jgi:hypothetical protein
MGYQVDHFLTYTGHDLAFNAMLVMFKGRAEDVVAQAADKKYLFYGESVYDDEMNEAMLPVSKMFPGILFKVTSKWEQGIGGDITDTYYRDGKMAFYKAVVTMPEFKEGDLK